MEYWSSKLDMPEVTGTLSHPLPTRLTLEIPVDCAQPRIHQSAHLGLVCRLVHNLGMLDLSDRVRFLWYRGQPEMCKRTLENIQFPQERGFQIAPP